MYYHNDRWKNPSRVLAPLLLSIVHLHPKNGKATRTAITLVGLGRRRSALCPFADSRFTSCRHHLDSLPVPDPDLHIHGVCDRHGAWIQHLPPPHRSPPELPLYAGPGATAVDSSHRSEYISGGTVRQRRRTFVFRDIRFPGAPARGGPAFL